MYQFLYPNLKDKQSIKEEILIFEGEKSSTEAMGGDYQKQGFGK
ncbi:hypothetical protein OLS59_04650 [Campylobacter jejuni]|nr:hypothetical protein [Campylobacter jejuni]MCW1552554.1 hypothetical protein [Campylobacter jejuni]